MIDTPEILSGQVCAMLAFDIAGYTRPDRDEDTRIHLHRALYKILRAAFDDSGIPWRQCPREGRGDGSLVIVPPGIPPAHVFDPFLSRLQAAIRSHNSMAAGPALMQLRVALHIGPVYAEGDGIVGDDINLLFLLLDTQPLRKALAGSDAELALVVSDDVYRMRVQRHPSLIAPDLFQLVRTRVKGTQIHGWIYVPRAQQLRRGGQHQPEPDITPRSGPGTTPRGNRPVYSGGPCRSERQ